jgi:hypothetical protein
VHRVATEPQGPCRYRCVWRLCACHRLRCPDRPSVACSRPRRSAGCSRDHELGSYHYSPLPLPMRHEQLEQQKYSGNKRAAR